MQPPEREGSTRRCYPQPAPKILAYEHKAGEAHGCGCKCQRGPSEKDHASDQVVPVLVLRSDGEHENQKTNQKARYAMPMLINGVSARLVAAAAS